MIWLGCVLLSSLAVARAEDIPLRDVPKPVMDAVKARFKDATVVGAAKEEDEDKKPVYELNLKLKDQTIDVILTPAGDIVLFEKSISLNDLPEAVAKTLKEKYPKATYKSLEEFYKVQNKKETLAFYEAKLVTAAKKELEVKITAEGKIFSEKEVSSD
jgi:hypothetical protein